MLSLFTHQKPVGFIRKFPNTRTEECPFQLFLYDGPFVPGETDATLVDNLYGYGSLAACKHHLLRLAAAHLEERSKAKA